MKIIPGLVSVIMSNYNTSEKLLREAIDSVLCQTYKNFEFIIVDDCSTDNSSEIIKSYNDARIVFLENEVNSGITKSLNVALKAARGEYVARMDADDFSFPERFQRQVDYLKSHKDVVVCGTWVELFGDGAYKQKEHEVCKIIPKKEEFQTSLLFGNHINIIHPTAMFRHSALIENDITYNENYIFAQDYRMWIDCSRIGECANVPDILFRYRIHNKAVSSEKKFAQADCTRRIIGEQLSWFDLDLPDNWETVHFGFFIGRKKYNTECLLWIKKLIKANDKKHVLDEEVFKKMLWKKWAETVYFGMKGCSLKEKIKRLKTLPLKYYPELIKIFLKRRKG